jgi:hypothetical protein
VTPSSKCIYLQLHSSGDGGLAYRHHAADHRTIITKAERNSANWLGTAGNELRDVGFSIFAFLDLRRAFVWATAGEYGTVEKQNKQAVNHLEHVYRHMLS